MPDGNAEVFDPSLLAAVFEWSGWSSHSLQVHRLRFMWSPALETSKRRSDSFQTERILLNISTNPPAFTMHACKTQAQFSFSSLVPFHSVVAQRQWPCHSLHGGSYLVSPRISFPRTTGSKYNSIVFV
mmetsp:Transcript_3033/g.11653  ORF Transcript_3033/g.11653 Transcript_3033/m.11653 type:complete len:128 (+) Transcript_3033:272-655(+)